MDFAICTFDARISFSDGFPTTREKTPPNKARPVFINVKMTNTIRNVGAFVGCSAFSSTKSKSV